MAHRERRCFDFGKIEDKQAKLQLMTCHLYYSLEVQYNHYTKIFKFLGLGTLSFGQCSLGCHPSLRKWIPTSGIVQQKI
jgi:hypothetical protein